MRLVRKRIILVTTLYYCTFGQKKHKQKSISVLKKRYSLIKNKLLITYQSKVIVTVFFDKKSLPMTEENLICTTCTNFK